MLTVLALPEFRLITGSTRKYCSLVQAALFLSSSIWTHLAMAHFSFKNQFLLAPLSITVILDIQWAHPQEASTWLTCYLHSIWKANSYPNLSLILPNHYFGSEQAQFLTVNIHEGWLHLWWQQYMVSQPANCTMDSIACSVAWTPSSNHFLTCWYSQRVLKFLLGIAGHAILCKPPLGYRGMLEGAVGGMWYDCGRRFWWCRSS